jgi:hypothetical protein
LKPSEAGQYRISGHLGFDKLVDHSHRVMGRDGGKAHALLAAG